MLTRLRSLGVAATLALALFGALVPRAAYPQATQLPNGEQCFQATTGVNGFVGTLGTITGGTGGTAGTYGGVALTGGSGTGATANITVSGGAVTGVSILNPGINYLVSDTLSAASGNIGNVTGFSVPVASIAINSAVAGGTVGMYLPGTLTPAQTWQNAAETILNSDPVPLDSNGCAIIYGVGNYRQILSDSLGNTVWDRLTSTPSGLPYWAGIANGTANAITLTNAPVQDGQITQFIAAASNTGATTINGIPVVKNFTTGAAALTGGEIQNNTLTQVSYSAAFAEYFMIAPIEPVGVGSQVTIASASTVDLGTAPGHLVNITGTSSITSFGSSASTTQPIYYVVFGGAPTVVYNATSMITPTGGNLTPSLGANALLQYLGAGNWKILAYNPSSSGAGVAAMPPPQGRLTLTTATPVQVANVSAASTVYYTPDVGNQVPQWNGGSFASSTCAENSNVLANSATGSAGPAAAVANAVYDLFVWYNSGICTLTRGPLWSQASGVSISIATPAVITWNGHGLVAGQPIIFSTTGTLPTGLTAGTVYYVIAAGLATNTFEISTSVGGAAVNTTGSQTGVQSAISGSYAGRGTGAGTTQLTRVNGFLVNQFAITNGPQAGYGLYVGTIMTDASAATVTFAPNPAAANGGPTTGSGGGNLGAWIGLWNEYNRVMVSASEQDNTASWSYSAATWRPSDNSNSNRINYVVGFADDEITSRFVDVVRVTGTIVAATGIGVNSITAPNGGNGGFSIATSANTVSSPLMAEYTGPSTTGRNYLQAMENAVTGTVPFIGLLSSVAQVHQLSAQLMY
ncbi:MAG: hypothetical protein P4L76_18110 [Beijerinckiaceae bacterium]|nr:hypothetical protein [Beijerinckiaceae bacterium]